MQQTEFTDDYGRRVIRREWRNTEGELHRTPGPAVENWTVLPGGGHVLSYQAWYLNGKLHRGRPAVRWWHIAEDGKRVLVEEQWRRHGGWHRVGRPAYRQWTVQPDGTRRLTWESWRVNGVQHRVDGPAYGVRSFYWQGVEVRQGDLPWLRRGHDLLAAWTGATVLQHVENAHLPAWSQDPRVARTHAAAEDAVVAVYRSAVGGSVVLCV